MPNAREPESGSPVAQAANLRARPRTEPAREEPAGGQEGEEFQDLESLVEKSLRLGKKNVPNTPRARLSEAFDRTDVETVRSVEEFQEAIARDPAYWFDNVVELSSQLAGAVKVISKSKIETQQIQDDLQNQIINLSKQLDNDEEEIEKLRHTNRTLESSLRQAQEPVRSTENGNRRVHFDTERTRQFSETPSINVPGAPRAVLPKLPVFDGGKDSAWKSWAAKAKRKILVDGAAIGEAEAQVAHLLSRLDGKASSLAEDYQEYQGDFVTPNQLLVFLEDHYGDQYERETARAKLRNLKMEAGKPNALEKFRTYRDEFRRLTAITGRAASSAINDADNIHDFTAGMPRWLGALCNQQLRNERNFYNFMKEAELIVRQEENTQRMYPDQAKSLDINKSKGGMNRGGGTLSGRSMGGRGKDNRDNLQHRFPKELPASLIDQRRKDRLCLSCGESGHAWRECTNGLVRSGKEKKMSTALVRAADAGTEPELESVDGGVALSDSEN